MVKTALLPCAHLHFYLGVGEAFRLTSLAGSHGCAAAQPHLPAFRLVLLPRPVHIRTMKPRIGLLLILWLAAASAHAQMTSNEVVTVLRQALTRANYFYINHLATNAVVAVVDREGFVLGVRSFTNASALDTIDAITKGGTAAFLSSRGESFTSRTAGFIVQQHFPPGINNTPTGPLVGVNFSSMSISDINYFKNPNTYSTNAFGGGGTNGTPITTGMLAGLTALSGLAGSPGGVPLYRGTNLIGGVGAVLTGKPPIPELYDLQQTAGQKYDIDEDVALAGQTGFAPNSKFIASHVFINGLALPYVASTTRLNTNALISSLGNVVMDYEITGSPTVDYPALDLGIPHESPGEMRAPIIDDPIPGPNRLTAVDVTNIIKLAARRAAITRGGIRLPSGQAAQVFITVVNNPVSRGEPPSVLGTYRTPDATIFSWDVAIQKARTALYFSKTNFYTITNVAFSTRAVGFLSEFFYPPGINGTTPGPFYSLQERFSVLPAGVTNPLNHVYFTPANAPTGPEPELPNGITIFPGGFPLYKNGELVGAIGISGDGVDQDDIIGASGTVSNLPPSTVTRTDQIIFRNTRLPYAKFPRNPTL